MANEEFSPNELVNVRLITYSDASSINVRRADFVLVPSMFEPCGLTQMIAMRYGALPIVRSTGGPRYRHRLRRDQENGNGFVFTVCRRPILRRVHSKSQQNVQDQEVSRVARTRRQSRLRWEASGNVYAELYEFVIKRHTLLIFFACYCIS